MTFIKKLVCSSYLYWVLKLIAYNDEELRNQWLIQEPCHILDETFNNFLPLPIAVKSSILNVAEFLDLPLKTLPCTETNPVSCKNQSYYFEMRSPLSKVSITFYNMMKYLYVAFWTFASTILFLWTQSMVIQSQNYL